MPGDYPHKIKQLPLYDGQFDAYKLSADGADVLFASYPAGTHIAEHRHNTDNYGVITKGELTLVMDGQTKLVKVGDWYHVPADKLHAATFKVETDEIEFWFAASQ
jgi:quercetin dioxygenase-like cupin family protein